MFHRPEEAFTDDGAHGRQLLVAASPNDGVDDTHWYRPDFNLALVQDAQAAGAIYLDERRAWNESPISHPECDSKEDAPDRTST